MAVQIDALEVTVDNPPSVGGASGATPAGPLPQWTEPWRLAWPAARQAEQQARWAATDRDDER